MDELVGHALVLIGIPAIFLVGPALAVFLLTRRKRMARRRRRAPVVRRLLRDPGHTLREQMDDLGANIGFEAGLLMMLPLLVLSMFLAQGHVRGLASMQRLAPVYAVLAVAALAYQLYRLLRASAQMDKLRAGYDAEVAAGQELDQLMRQGAAVFHDFPAENFNIDHVVISAQGVFAVETKGFTKLNTGEKRADATVTFDGRGLRFPTWATSEPLEQAERQAAWLARWLKSAVGDVVPVLPVLVLPGWFVHRAGRGSVRVFSGRELGGLLKSSDQTLSDQDVQRVLHQVEQRCRTVEPRYRDDEKAI
jgi:hypothetical protein